MSIFMWSQNSNQHCTMRSLSQLAHPISTHALAGRVMVQIRIKNGLNEIVNDAHTDSKG